MEAQDNLAFQKSDQEEEEEQEEAMSLSAEEDEENITVIHVAPRIDTPKR